VSLSGFVVGRHHPGDAALVERRPPVFWGRGTLDERIPDSAIATTEAWLPLHSDLSTNIYEMMGHGISNAELKDVNSFIRAHL
jgi:phospholipase/carboxylesterase